MVKSTKKKPIIIISSITKYLIEIFDLAIFHDNNSHILLNDSLIFYDNQLKRLASNSKTASQSF